MSGIGPNHKED